MNNAYWQEIKFRHGLTVLSHLHKKQREGMRLVLGLWTDNYPAFRNQNSSFCTCVLMYVCMYVRTYVYVCMFVSTYVYMYVYIYIYMYENPFAMT